MPDSPEGRLSAERRAEIDDVATIGPGDIYDRAMLDAIHDLLAVVDAQAATIEDLTAERDQAVESRNGWETVAYEEREAKAEALRRAAADTPKLQAAQRWVDEWRRYDTASLRAASDALAAAVTEEPAAPQPTCPECSSPIGVTENDYGDPAFCKNPIHAAVTEEPAAPSVREAFMSLTLPVFAIETMSALGWATFGEGDEDARDAALDAFIDACRRARPDLAPNYDRAAEEPAAPEVTP